MADITSIAIHHSLTRTGSALAFARYHISLGWPGIGYGYVIDSEGIIYKTARLSEITYHVGDSNRSAVGVCIIGNFDEDLPTQKALLSAAWLVRYLRQEMPNHPQPKRHHDYPGYAWKSCPGKLFPWETFLKSTK